MRTIVICTLVLNFCTGVLLTGCGPKKAASSNAAIEESKTMQTAQEKVNYLVGQAKAFYNSKDLQSSIDIAQYVISYLDRDSKAAKDIIEKAKNELAALASKKVEDLKGQMKGFGK